MNIIPDVFTNTIVDMLSRFAILHCTFDWLKVTPINTVKTIMDSIYSSLLYCVNIVLTPIAKLFILFIIEVLLYMMERGVDPGRVTLHTRCTVSLLDCIEQLYDIVSPGQSISDLIVFLSSKLRKTDAREK